jgi:enoyl-CoA hydratase/carnithine racemase
MPTDQASQPTEYRTLQLVADRGVALVTRAIVLTGAPPAFCAGADLASGDDTAPMSVAASKPLLWESFDLDRQAVGRRETAIHLALMGHDDARAGVRAFMTGRVPEWTGRPVDPTA